MIWGQAAKNWGQLAGWGARTAWNNPTGRAGIIGAAAGAGWGMLSEDTSVIGGAMMGAAIGAAGRRYGGSALSDAGMRRGWNAAGGAYASGAGVGAIASNLGSGILSGIRRAGSQARSDISNIASQARGGFGFRGGINIASNSSVMSSPAVATSLVSAAREPVMASNQAAAGSAVPSSLKRVQDIISAGRRRNQPGSVAYAKQQARAARAARTAGPSGRESFLAMARKKGRGSYYYPGRRNNPVGFV